MTALAGGLIALILGIILIIAWWGFFIKALMAGIPALLILGGALATYLGIEEMKDRKASESFDTPLGDPKDDLKSEVDSLKEEIKELKDEKTSAEKEIKELKTETKPAEKETKETKAEKKPPEKEDKK